MTDVAARAKARSAEAAEEDVDAAADAEAVEEDVDAVEEADAAADAPEETGASGSGVRREASTDRAIVRTLVAAVVLFCAFGGWQLWAARTDDDLAYSAARDAVRSAGSEHITTLNTVDRTRVADALKQWRAASTGPLAAELRRTERQNALDLKKSGTSADATVTDAAVIQLDNRAGTAELIATVRIKVTARNGEPNTDRKRFEAGLQRTGGGWKLKSLRAVPAGEG